MRAFTCIFAFLTIAVPALAQEPENEALNIGGQFAFGNLAVRELMRANDPVQQLKAFFDDAGLPLSRQQEQKLDGIVEAQQKGLRGFRDRGARDETTDAIRRLNQEYMKLVNGALTPAQQSAWRHYRVEQLRLRGGLPALKAILDHAGAQLADNQEQSIAKIFENFAMRRAQLIEANPKGGIADIDRLVIAEFNRVVALLTTEQRKALQRSQRATTIASAK